MGTLIGIGGLKTAGKDVVADALVEELGYVKLGMSDNLHTCLMVLNPIVGRHRLRLERYRELVERVGFVESKTRPEVRRLQKTIGTEVGRELIDVNVWVNMTERALQSMLDTGHDVVVTGIRFRNELEMIQRLTGTTLWVERPGVEAGDTHASETSLSARDFALVVVNAGTVEDLRQVVISSDVFA